MSLSRSMTLMAKAALANTTFFSAFRAAVFEYAVENFRSLVWGCTTVEFFRADGRQTEVGRPEDFLHGVGLDFEITRQRDFVISVYAVHDTVTDTQLLIHAAVQPHLVQVGHA